jgi:hypothetical protein
MSHTVVLSEATIARLQKLDLTVPLVDSIESVVNKLADFYERSDSARRGVVPNAKPIAPAPRQFNAYSPPDLTYTKVLSVKFDGASLGKASWNGLLFKAIRGTKSHLKTIDDARRLIIVNFIRGRKDDEGYHFLPEVDLSVQGQDANSAWRGTSHIAVQLGIPLEVEFLWRSKKRAAYPGVTGRLSI